MTIGLPASGKSYLRRILVKRNKELKVVNNDEKLEMSYNDLIIDDNTNLSLSDRKRKLKEYECYYKVGILFDYDLETCWHLNWIRMYWFGEKLLPKVIYHTLKKKFDSSKVNEGFDNLISIRKVFRNINFDNKVKYYF